MGLQVESLSGGYRGRRLFDGLSLQLLPGATVLLGPNGAGKTTLLRWLGSGGRVKGLTGRLSVGGQDVATSAERRKVLRAMSYLPQTWTPIPGFTALECVAYAAWLKGLSNRDAFDAAVRALNGVGLAGSTATKAHRLSGGMQRRVALAECLASDPGILFLDEPTVGLDPQQSLSFRRLIRSLSIRSTLLISTHLLPEAEALSDRVMILDEGTIKFAGRFNELQAAAAEPARAGVTPSESGYLAVLERAVAP